MKKNNKQLVLSVAFAVAITTTVQPFDKSTVKAKTIEEKEVHYHMIPNKEETTSYVVPDQTSLNKGDSIFVETIMSNQAKAVMRYIEKAEISLSGEDVYLAQLLIEKVPEKEKEVLSKRLKLIKPTVLINDAKEVQEAESQVTLAEQDIKNEKQMKKAQEHVVSLKMSEEKMALIERLNAMYQILIKEREQKYQQALQQKRNKLT